MAADPKRFNRSVAQTAGSIFVRSRKESHLDFLGVVKFKLNLYTVITDP
jgi:hypothetical protein